MSTKKDFKTSVTDTASFIAKGNLWYNYFYDYSEVEYKLTNLHVRIICPAHGVFLQTPNNHLHPNKYGCTLCAIEKRRKLWQYSLEKRIEQSIAIHGNKYDYGLIKSPINNAHQKVPIICINCESIFWQGFHSHINNKCGCWACGHLAGLKEGRWLDSLNITIRQKHISIGNKWVFVDGFDPITNTCYEFNGDFWHGNPDKYPVNKLFPHLIHGNQLTFGELYARTLKKEADLIAAGYKVITKWETDLKVRTTSSTATVPNHVQKSADEPEIS